MKSFKILMLLLIALFMVSCNENKSDELNYRNGETLILTMYSEDLKKEDVGFSNSVADEIVRLTGVKLDVKYPVESVSDKIDLMINSGDYPDLIMVKDTHKLVDANAYLDLTPLLLEYGPNLMKLYGGYINRLKFSQEDSSIYVLPTKPVDEIDFEPILGFQLQHAVVKSLGFPEMKTVKDYEKAIKEYMKMYPEIDGEKTLGLSFVIEDWRWKITIGNSAGFATGTPDDGNWYIDPDTYEATYRFLREEEREFYKWLNHMYSEGLIDPDSFVQSLDSYYSKIASGRVLGLLDAKWNYGYPEQLLRSKGLVDRMYGRYPIQMDATTNAADFRDIGYIAGYGIGISKNCKDPIEAIKFLDFMASDQGQILRFWGIENEHFYYDELGVRRIYEEEKNKKIADPDYASQTGIGIYEYPFPMWGVGKKDSSNNYYNPDNRDFVISNYTEIEKEVLDAYNASTWADLYPSSDELPKSLWGEAWDIPIPADSSIRYQLTECDRIMKESIVKAIIAEPELFDEIWDQILIDLNKAGVHKMEIEFTKLVKKRIEFWSDDNE